MSSNLHLLYDCFLALDHVEGCWGSGGDLEGLYIQVSPIQRGLIVNNDNMQFLHLRLEQNKY